MNKPNCLQPCCAHFIWGGHVCLHWISWGNPFKGFKDISIKAKYQPQGGHERKSQGIIRVIYLISKNFVLHERSQNHLVTLNISIKFHDKPSNISLDVSVWTKWIKTTSEDLYRQKHWGQQTQCHWAWFILEGNMILSKKWTQAEKPVILFSFSVSIILFTIPFLQQI